MWNINISLLFSTFVKSSFCESTNNLTRKQVIRIHIPFKSTSTSNIFGEYPAFPSSAIFYTKEPQTGSLPGLHLQNIFKWQCICLRGINIRLQNNIYRKFSWATAEEIKKIGGPYMYQECTWQVFFFQIRKLKSSQPTVIKDGKTDACLPTFS